MDMAIKEIVIPFLRDHDFKGSYPHFRRVKGDRLNLLTFQFSLYASRFVVEISSCPAVGDVVVLGKTLKPSECRVHYFGNRFRIGSVKNKTDYWYIFEKESFFKNIYKSRAKEIITNWGEAEKWWIENPFEKENN